MTFSERNGIATLKELQIEDMDKDLFTSLWICLEDLFDELWHEAYKYDSPRSKYRDFLCFIWTEFFKRPKNELIHFNEHRIVHAAIKNKYDHFSWDRVYSLLEFVARVLQMYKKSKVDEFKAHCNHVLERENSGWRFVSNEIARIVEPCEIQCIEQVFEGVGKESANHLRQMLLNFSQKPEKDFRGCATEAILALEAYAREVAGEKSKILSDLCAGEKLPLHKTLRKSLGLLYAFANDEIRHAEKQGSDEVDYETAKFMMLQCTSYINLIKSKRKGESGV